MAEEVVGLLRHVLQLDRSDLAKGFALAGADADAFKRKVDKAMTDAERSMAKPEQAVRRLEAAMRGDRLLQSANNIVAAMNKVGGAAKLTDAEQARYNATLSKAVEKYKQLGQEAPKALLAAEAATRKAVPATDALAKGMTDVNAKATLAQRGTSALVGTVGQMAAGFTLATVTMRAFGGLLNLGRQAIETSDHLVDMSAKTGLSTEMLQRLDFVADQAGGTLDNFTDASFRLGVKLSGGGSSVSAAVKDLNLNLAALRAAKPDEQLMLVVDALAKVENEGERNRLGMALFGKQYASIASSVAQNMREIAKGAHVMADENVKALADAKDEWGKFYNFLVAESGNWLGQARRDITAAANGWAAFFEDFRNMQRKASGADEWRPSRIGKGDIELPADPTAPRVNAPPKPKTAVQQVAEIDAQLKAFRKSKADVAELTAAIELGGDALQAAMDKFDLSPEAVARFSDGLKGGTKATKDAEKALLDLAEARKKLQDQIFGRDDVAEATKLTDALFAEGPVDFSKIGADQLKRIKDVTEKAIKLYKDMGAEIPWAVQQAFNGSARQIGSVMDIRGLANLTLGGDGVFGESQQAQIDRENEFRGGARAAFPDPSSRMDTTELLKDWEFAADGTLRPFRELDDIVNDMAFEFRKLSQAGGRNPMEAWISNVDMLSRSFDAAGLSVSRYTDAALSGLQAGNMLRTGGWQNKAAGAAVGVGSMAAATGSGTRTNRIVGGAISGAMTTAALTGTLAATGVKVGALGGWPGMAVGAGVGAAIGFARSRIVGKDEKEARKAFESWQKQVIANFDVMAKEQGRVTSEMTDWEKMVESVAAAYEATGRTVEDMHHDMQALSDATRGSAEDVAAALEHINGVLNEQAADFELLDATLSKYGFSLEEAGDKFQAKTLHGQAKQLADEYRVLLDNGVDAAAIHERMSGSVSKWLQDTIRTGTAIPSLMQPVLESFAKQGKLLDENGLLMDEAAVKGLDFKDVWSNGMDRVALKLDAVIQRLGAMVSMLTGMPAETVLSAHGSIAGQTAAPPAASRTVTIMGRQVTIPPASAQVQVPSQFMGPLTLPDGATSSDGYFQQFDPATMPKMHTGGIVERAHDGAVVGSHLFGRMASDEMPMILQRGEAVVKRTMTNRMGGARWADAVNGGDMPRAVSMMTSAAAVRDPFADMGRLIEMPNRFPSTPAAAVAPAAAAAALAKGDGGTVVNVNISQGAISVNGSGNPAHDADVILNEVVAGLHTNRKGFRTKVIQKVAKGN